jgi:hypothetical protein
VWLSIEGLYFFKEACIDMIRVKGELFDMRKGKKGKNTKRKKKEKKGDHGSMSFHCQHCDYDFEVEWETIWDIQECTHGYVGYHTNDVYISCPKCDRVVNDDDDDSIF